MVEAVAALPVKATGRSAPADRAGGAAKGSGFRPDIEGLRAVAVGVVLLYHAGIVFVPGGFVGVDVFFVISGFLITGLLVREVERTGRISLVRFYARRARRLLPAAAVVLIVTALLTWLTASQVDWRTFGSDIVAAALYVENWQLAARSVDYLAEGTGASPVQHYWSLSVEEQFYILWPLLLLLVVIVVRVRKWNVRATMAAGLALIVVPSFIWSVVSTAASPATAYFVTTTRLWELGVGALVAVTVGFWARLPLLVARIIGWAGLAAIIASALFLDSSMPWPGSLALLPVLGTAAVIIAGTSDQNGIGRLLGLKPMVWVGGLSYALYLWHWPLLITAENVIGEYGQKIGLVIALASFIPAYLSTRFVENPIRFSQRLSASNGITLSVGFNLTAAAVVAGLVLVLAVPQAAAPSAQQTADRGAAGLTYDDDSITGVKLSGSVATMVPSATQATEDVPASSTNGCMLGFDAVEPKLCSIGADTGDVTVVVVGDSKIQQWSDTLGSIAKANGWEMLLATKSACGFADALRALNDTEDYLACPEYNAALMKELLEIKPDAVITSQRHSTAYIPGTRDLSADAMRDALAENWSILERAGIDVLALLDNPAPKGLPAGGGEVYRCLAEVDDPGDCAFPRERGVEGSGAVGLVAAAQLVDDVDVIDMTDAMCDEMTCPPIIGDVLVYRQGSHLTNTYVKTLEPILASRLVSLMEEGPAR